jgi:hypothetical protein
MRVHVYVDGFNLYYRALKGTRYKWLDPVALARRLLDPTDTVLMLRYFTARVKARGGDPGAPRRQQIYLSALATLPETRCHFGRFLAKTKFRPLASNPSKFVEVLDTEEKGSDVNLAAHLINDAWRQRFDVALVMSQDTDLSEPIRMVSRDLALPVGVVWLDGGRPNGALLAAASFVRHIQKADLAAAQFPDPVAAIDGGRIPKPQGW